MDDLWIGLSSVMVSLRGPNLLMPNRQKIYTTTRTSKGNCIEQTQPSGVTSRHKHLTPTYVNIRIKGKNPQNQKTLRTAK